MAGVATANQLNVRGDSGFNVAEESGHFRLWARATPLLSVSGGGNVGIGTTAPAAKLDVAGDARADSLILNGASSTGTCNRGQVKLVQGATDDTLYVCMMKGGALGWRAVTTS